MYLCRYAQKHIIRFYLYVYTFDYPECFSTTISPLNRVSNLVKKIKQYKRKKNETKSKNIFSKVKCYF